MSVAHRGSALGQFMRFAAVGVSNAIVSLSADGLLLAAGAPFRLAAAGAFTAGAINGYTWNRRWTFAASDSMSARACYLLVQIGGLAATIELVAAIEAMTRVGHFPAYLLSAVPVTAGMFLANRRWTFNSASRPSTRRTGG